MTKHGVGPRIRPFPLTRRLLDFHQVDRGSARHAFPSEGSPPFPAPAFLFFIRVILPHSKLHVSNCLRENPEDIATGYTLSTWEVTSLSVHILAFKLWSSWCQVFFSGFYSDHLPELNGQTKMSLKHRQGGANPVYTTTSSGGGPLKPALTSVCLHIPWPRPLCSCLLQVFHISN